MENLTQETFDGISLLRYTEEDGQAVRIQYVLVNAWPDEETPGALEGEIRIRLFEDDVLIQESADTLCLGWDKESFDFECPHTGVEISIDVS